MAQTKIHFTRNVLILALSLAAALLLAKAGLFETILHASQGAAFFGAFIAGLFFTSVITVAPATIALAAFGSTGALSPFIVAAIGALGSVIGDFILFRFVRAEISEDFAALFKRPRVTRLVHALHLEAFRFFTPFIGFLVIASPLPDELGIALMGISKIRARSFALLSYTANFLGILIVASIGRAL